MDKKIYHTLGCLEQYINKIKSKRLKAYQDIKNILFDINLQVHQRNDLRILTNIQGDCADSGYFVRLVQCDTKQVSAPNVRSNTIMVTIYPIRRAGFMQFVYYGENTIKLIYGQTQHTFTPRGIMQFDYEKRKTLIPEDLVDYLTLHQKCSLICAYLFGLETALDYPLDGSLYMAFKRDTTSITIDGYIDKEFFIMSKKPQ